LKDVIQSELNSLENREVCGHVLHILENIKPLDYK
jgi:hypothetical protein